MLALHLLGAVELRRDDQPLPLPVRKTVALLVLLALGGPMPRARAAGLLWPDLDESTARRNLRRELARVRDQGAGDAIQADADRLALADGVQLDADRFQQMLRASDGDPEAALRWWRGPLADGLDLDDTLPFATWLGAERERLAALWREAMDRAAAAAEARGETDAALAWLDRLLADDPLQERHHRAAMRLLAAAGRREAALARYQRCRDLLQAELGLSPMADTEALAVALRGPAPLPLSTPVAAPAARPYAAGSGDAPPRQRRLLPEQLPFVGREPECLRLEQAWRSGCTLLIEGEGGVGKSRLAIDFAAAQGPYALSRCRAGDAELPLASFARALRVLAGPVPAVQDLPEWARGELARLLPELGPAPLPVRSVAERTRFGQACALAWRAWASGNFDAVLIDDWHLADPASQAMLAQMEPGDGQARQVLVYRPELLPAAAALLRRQREAGAAHLLLAPLPSSAVFELVRQLSGARSPDRFAALLSRATAGHPFYVGETLRHLVEAGLLSAGEDGVWQTPFDEATQDYRELPLPASVRDAVLARVRRLPEPALRVLEAAALAQEPFAAALLAPACALSEVETSLALEAAHEASLLREHDGGGFAFAHDLVQQALESALDGGRRRSVHRRLALGAAAAGAAPALVAAHHEAGGEAVRAVAWRRRAADDAMRMLALDEAIAHWRQALADGAEGDDAVAIGVALVRALTLRSRHDEALGASDDLLQRVDAGHGSLQWRAEALIALAAMHARAERGEHALDLLGRLPALTDGRLQALALQARSEASRSLGHIDEARHLARAALDMPGPSVDERSQMLDSLMLSEFYGGHLREALVCADQSLALSRAMNDGLGIARALGRRAAMLSELGESAAAEQGLSEAAQLAGRLGLLGQQRTALFNLCALYSAMSRPVDVLRVARECWDLPPPIALEPLRTQMQLAFVEAHGALGHLGEGLHWALGAIDDATAIGQLVGRVTVLHTAAELLAVLGETDRLTPLMAGLDTAVAEQLQSTVTEMWLVHTECALMAGDLATARRRWASAQAVAELESSRLGVRRAIVDAAMCLAEGDATGALAVLPADDAAGQNEELRWRALAVRLRAEAAAGGCTLPSLQAARRALAPASGPGRHPPALAGRTEAHALAALALHRALVAVDDRPAQRAAWQARVERLAATLADEPPRQAAFLARWHLT